MRCVFDLEGNALYDDITVIHCGVFYDIDENKKYEFRPHEVESMLVFMDKCSVLIGHNVLGFDFPALEKLYGYVFTGHVFDTFTLSSLSNPDRYGGHSVANWAKLLKLDQQKVEHEDWSIFTEDMMHRCSTDVDIQKEIYFALKRELVGNKQTHIDWGLSIKLEHSISRIITDQEHRGVPFNTDLARGYQKYLDKELEEIVLKVSKILGYKIKESSVVDNPFIMAGGYRANVKNRFKGLLSDVYEVVGRYTPIDFIQIKPTMYKEVKNVLVGLGWKPVQFTPTGQPSMPKLEDLEKIAERTGNTGLTTLARFGSISNRANIIRKWIEIAQSRNNTLPAGAFTNGTNTGRFKHTTVVNVPRATSDKVTGELVYAPEKQPSFFGTEMRSLFWNGGDENYKVVGADAAGLELRCLAHYLNNKSFTDTVLDGDVHTLFWEAAGGVDWIASRSDMKSVTYGWLYGAGDLKIAEMCTSKRGEPQTQWGRTVRNNLLSGVSGLKALVDHAVSASGRGYLRCIDGRKVYMRKTDGKVQTHKALNTLLQSTGGIVIKMWTHLVNREVKKQGLDARQIIHMHDEMQWLCHNKDISKLSQILEDCMIKAGKFFKMNIRLDADVKVGVNWAETH